jgi:hypothetical protein
MKKRTKKARAPKKPRLKKPREPKVGEYLGNEYESFCELSLLYFVEELIQMGYATKVVRSPSYTLCEPVISSYAVQLKKGSKQEVQSISQGVTYTPDYDIYFTEKAIGLFCWELGSNTKWEKNLLVAQRIDGKLRACCEVKPDFQRNSTTPKRRGYLLTYLDPTECSKDYSFQRNIK